MTLQMVGMHMEPPSPSTPQNDAAVQYRWFHIYNMRNLRQLKRSVLGVLLGCSMRVL